jgi:hypothetical protein
VDGRSGNLEMATHVGFGRGAFEDPAIGVDEGQVLALELRKAGAPPLGVGQVTDSFPIHLRLDAEGGADEYKVSCRA